MDAPPGQVNDFTVQERLLQYKREELRNLSYKQLQNYFKNKYLDEQTYQELQAVLDGWAEIDRIEKEVADYEQRKSKIYTAQEQIQKNMGVLERDGEEGKLRDRYVQQLSQSEEELADIDQTISRLQNEIAQRRARLGRMIAELSAT